MKYILMLFIGGFLTMFIVSVYLVYTVEPGQACMLDYVKELKKGKKDGYFYRNGEVYHIDTRYLSDYGEVIGRSNGCLIYSQKKIYLGVFNTVYCATTYILK